MSVVFPENRHPLVRLPDSLITLTLDAPVPPAPETGPYVDPFGVFDPYESVVDVPF